MSNNELYIGNLNIKFMFAIVLHAIFVVVECIAGIRTNSVSLIADALHNAADVIGVLVAWFSYWIARKKAPNKFTFGFKRATIISVFFNALVLLVSVGGIVWEAVMRLFSPKDVVSTTMMLVAAFGVLVNGFTAYLFAHNKNVDLNVRGVFIHFCADTLVSAGVIVAGAIIFYKGWLWADPIMSIIAALFIFFSTWRLFVDSINFMLMAVPDSIDFVSLQKYLTSNPRIINYHNLHIWPISFNEFALSVHIIVNEENFRDSITREVSEIIEKRYNISHITIQMEIITV